jgi:DNA-binding NarL/FixJ family response regulator
MDRLLTEPLQLECIVEYTTPELIPRVPMDRSQRAALIADPDDYFRIALETILIGKLGFSVVHHVTTLDAAFNCLINQPEISLSLFELNLPGVSGATSLTAVRDCFPQLQVAVVATSARRQDILMTLDAGAHGYVPKNAGPAELAAALKLIVDGVIYVPPSIASTSSLVVEGPVLNAKPAMGPAPDPLTQRQREVLRLVVQGKSNKEIARVLNIGEGTVKVHMAGLFRALGVNSRAAAAVAGMQMVADASQENELSAVMSSGGSRAAGLPHLRSVVVTRLRPVRDSR